MSCAPRSHSRPASTCCRLPASRRFAARSPCRACAGWCGVSFPAGRAPAVVARIELLLQQASPDLWDPGAAAVLLDRLDTEFPQAGDRALARGRVLEALARTGHRAIHPELLPPRMVKTLSVLLDGRLDRPGLLFAELMAASLEVDPYNREGYRFVLDLLRGHRDIKPR